METGYTGFGSNPDHERVRVLTQMRQALRQEAAQIEALRPDEAERARRLRNAAELLGQVIGALTGEEQGMGGFRGFDYTRGDAGTGFGGTGTGSTGSTGGYGGSLGGSTGSTGAAWAAAPARRAATEAAWAAASARRAVWTTARRASAPSFPARAVLPVTSKRTDGGGSVPIPAHGGP